MNPQNIINELEIICVSAGDFIRDHYGKIPEEQVESKQKNSLVSFVDRQAEQMITTALTGILPIAGFLTEEAMVVNNREEYRWIVDPLDGTTNYIVGIPHFAVSIGLVRNDDLVLGCVYDIMQKDFYHAVKGEGSFLNHTPIRVARPKPLDEAAIASGFPYDKSRIGESHLAVLRHFLKQARIFRRLGSAALDLCFVAKGTFDLYYEKNLNAWDMAAGALIVQEAGGIVMDFQKGADFLEKGEIIACSDGMVEEADRIIQLFEV